jgi:uncharacterized protein (DUF488 family)
MKSQVQRIIDVLQDGTWHCTSEFYADFMADPRRRMKDIQERGFTLESRTCESHTFHAGGSKEWRMAVVTGLVKQKPQPRPTYVEINGQLVNVNDL